jgi:hypothetical protein
MGTDNEIPDPAPYTVDDCQGADGPSSEVTDSGLGAFADGADWNLDGLWVGWDIE